MINILRCHWCNKKFRTKSKANSFVRFCSRVCQLAHWRARSAEKLRKYQSKYRHNNLDKVRASKRKWNDKNKDYRKLWYMANADVVKTNNLIGYRKQMHSRIQAKRIVKRLGINKECSVCHTIKDVQLHHVDGNSMNNEIKNLVYLCRKHHGEAHIKMNKYVTKR